MCGNRKIFSSYFRLKARCPQCGYEFAREDGYWVGAIIINTAVTFTVFFFVFLGMIIVTSPNIRWPLLLLIAAGTNVIFPVLFYPLSKTIWMAFDLVYLKRLER